MNVKAVVFDLDGTLTDSKNDIAVTANKTLCELGLPTLHEVL
ncbi:HAD hydrolase-like protein [Thermoanaerobacter pentosaceus]|uniref:Phosphoglycolate phosphatase-like HAD superfamily hydrolase n=1 Tax=Thermoanaerobacter pentosaceus TaxID=694059 RepID=A0ABT9M423_9THEO|nr:HAD hydrolase-like protein [Thermoanaerobacter pentosaceus]MDP9750888.1 phosphoglycolate phosphatase-like HAD superfamily hydrolase [Thermoanaerobacter pentosaceus]